MANEPLITVVGNATNDAEMRFTAGGVGVAAFNLAVTPRVKKGDSWEDGETTFFRCTVWRDMAEPVAETVTKGMRLIVHGRFKTRQYEKDGQTRTSVEIDVDEVGPSLRYATAKVNKMQRTGGNDNGSSRQPASAGSNRPQLSGPTADPWSSAEPPF